MPCVSIEQIAQAIMAYLQLHTNAKDTVEGIHLWWIDWPEDMPESMALTQASLEQLEAQGRVVCIVAGRRELWGAVRTP